MIMRKIKNMWYFSWLDVKIFRIKYFVVTLLDVITYVWHGHVLGKDRKWKYYFAVLVSQAKMFTIYGINGMRVRLSARTKSVRLTFITTRKQWIICRSFNPLRIRGYKTPKFPLRLWGWVSTGVWASRHLWLQVAILGGVWVSQSVITNSKRRFTWVNCLATTRLLRIM